MFGLSDNLLLHFVSSWGFKTFLVLHDYLLGREKNLNIDSDLLLQKDEWSHGKLDNRKLAKSVICHK